MSKFRIMIVEDEEIVAADLGKSVEKNGYIVCAMASTGMEAIKKADLNRPDLILMDIVLKGSMNGIEAAKKIKDLYQIPIVFLTAFGEDSVLEQARMAEPYGFLTKPFKDRDLHISIEISIYKKRAEDRIRKMELWLAAVLRSVGDAVIASDKNRVITFMNAVAEKLTGWKKEDALGKKLSEVLNLKEEDTDLDKHLLEKVISEGLIINLITDRLLIAKDGTELPISDSAAPIKDENGESPGSVIVFRDITEQKRSAREKQELQTQLLQAQKMESVGRLAGGVAHDFNNMLGVILGFVEMGMDQVDPKQPIHAYLTQIRKAATRSADLTRQLLAFARKQTIAPKVLNLNETVLGILSMLQRIIGENINLNWLPANDLWMVRMDPSQIDQILANLCVNAKDAISGMGKITIQTGNSTFLEGSSAVALGLAPGEYVKLTVNDDGCGMDKETIEHIFEPFFTTKGLGSGTGLGLATVYGAVKQNSGFITVDSNKGQGTTFSIYFPRYIGNTEKLPAPDIEEPPIRGHETILLVEDEIALLELITNLLESKGYTVLAANNPGQALRLAKEYHSEIHLLLTDVILPEMSGCELAKNVLSVFPKIKYLFMSGYPADVIAQHGVLDEKANFIQKPFSKKDLSAKLCELLDRK
ncbi:MAG: response regulator [Candidatus Riflebacteria bacterium]|nr:response regulator [Candidatus Riflebacteria bacterium]